MRIRQSARFVTQQTGKVLLRKTTIVALGLVVLAGGAIVYQNLLSTPATSYAVTPPDNCFAFDSATGTITDYYDNQDNNIANPACPKNVDIPSTIGGVQVIIIGDRSFYGSNLTGVTIPEGVTTIVGGAFLYSEFTSVAIPSTVTYIGDFAFGGGKLTSVTIPEGVTSIESFTFDGNDLTSVTFLGEITSIGDWAFQGNQLASITIPDGLTTIGDGVFSSNQLTSVTIPEGVTSIESFAFSHNKLSSLTIPSAVTAIGDYAFQGNQLTSLTIPSNVTSIGSSAFRANSLESIIIPDTVTSLGYDVFSANQLTSLTLGCGATSLIDQQFAMNKLQEVTIPDCITSIYPTTFFGQNPWGGMIDKASDSSPNWYSSDPEVIKTVYDNLWYARLYTADPTNPNNLIGGIANENWYTDDLTADGDWDDSIGGHLVNPASATVRYVDSSNTDLAVSSTFTGRLTDGTNLTNYLVKNVDVPPIVDLDSLTTEERAALIASLSQYYQVGENISLTAPTITGYTLLNPSSPRIFNLANKDNTATFVYGVPTPNNLKEDSTTDSTPTRSITQQPSGGSSAATADDSTDAPSTSNAPLTMIDFAAPRGSEHNPTEESVPHGLPLLMKKSRFTTDVTKSCSKIQSAKLLPDTSFTAQDKNYKTLGGLTFVLDCAKIGGDAAVTFTLGGTVPNLAQVNIYKQNASGVSTDITNRVSIADKTIDGNTRTTITYTLQDGKSLDDDDAENGSISDPIYITISEDDVSPPTANQPSWREGAIVATTIIIVASITIIVVAHKRRA